MKGSLLYPDFPDTIWSFKRALKFIHKRASLPPPGVLAASAMFPAELENRPAGMQRYSTMSLQYSRGCPFDCEFCNVTEMLGHRLYTRATVQVTPGLDGSADD